jgi:hypothetical protein
MQMRQDLRSVLALAIMFAAVAGCGASSNNAATTNTVSTTQATLVPTTVATTTTLTPECTDQSTRCSGAGDAIEFVGLAGFKWRVTLLSAEESPQSSAGGIAPPGYNEFSASVDIQSLQTDRDSIIPPNLLTVSWPCAANAGGAYTAGGQSYCASVTAETDTQGNNLSLLSSISLSPGASATVQLVGVPTAQRVRSVLVAPDTEIASTMLQANQSLNGLTLKGAVSLQCPSSC